MCIRDSDYGYVVGYWPSLAKSQSGTKLLAWQDVHGGSLQRDDLVRADLEVAIKNDGGWSYEAVDFGEGAGVYNRAFFDSEGRPAVLYYIPIEAAQAERVRLGIWLARKEGDEWVKFQLYAGATQGSPSVVVNSEGIWVAYYDAQVRRPIVCLLYTSPSPRDQRGSRMPSSA